MNRLQYQLYLLSPHWAITRLQVLKNPYYGDPEECFICGTEFRLQVHHLTYKRIGEEERFDMCIVCDKCHTLIHTNERDEFQSRDTFMRVFQLKYEFLPA